MKCLTLRQPWASLVSHGPKRIETRSWATKHRGQLLIHAGMGRDSGVSITLMQAGYNPLESLLAESRRLPAGAVVAAVELLDCVPIVQVLDVMAGRAPSWPNVQVNGADSAALVHPTGATVDVSDQIPLGDFAPGRWAWLLDGIRPLPEPVPVRGKQGLWIPTDDERSQVADQLKAVAHG